MITCDMIKHDILASYSCSTWTYNGKPCGIDPSLANGIFTLDMWYGEKDLIAHTWEKIFNTKFFDGKSLREVLKDIKDYDGGWGPRE